MNKIFTQLVEKRGLTDDFIHPKYENLAAPDVLLGIKEATTRIKKAIAEEEKILIYGDYDVDGITASTLMEQALILAGVKRDHIYIMLPDRFADGYGMSPRLIERAVKDQIALVITVDCGSRNHEIVEELNIHHIDTIVTDHHECGDTLPNAVAVINPKRKDQKNIFRDYAGVGVAFKLAEALRDAGLIKDGQEKWLLDLVLIGTICDSMPLTGENRILCYYGAKVLAKTKRRGLNELMRLAGVKSITSESIGFQIGPRLNAAGRLETAELSLALLRTNSSAEAASIAAKLESLNDKRRTEQRAAVSDIKARGVDDAPVIVEVGKYHEGIIGIVAGRLVEEYHRPAFVLTEIDGGVLKGSGRSFGDFSLADALGQVSDITISGGGHAAAAGVKLEQSQLYAFRERLNDYYSSLHLASQEDFFKTTPDLTLENPSDISLELLDDLALLEPYGAGNEEPIFCLENVEILEIRRLGDKKQHLCLIVKGSSGSLKCLAFNAKPSWLQLDDTLPHTIMVKPTVNEFRGVRSAEAYIVDII